MQSDGLLVARREKDPNAPTRPRSSFVFESTATRKAANPNVSFGEISQIVGRRFKALSKEERSYWDSKAKEDMERYKREMTV